MTMSDSADNKFISLEEAGELLETGIDEVQKIIAKGVLNAYKIGDKVLRLSKDEVSELKAKWRIEADLFQEPVPVAHPAGRAGGMDRVRDFLYYHDFYIISSAIIAALFYLILSSQ